MGCPSEDKLWRLSRCQGLRTGTLTLTHEADYVTVVPQKCSGCLFFSKLTLKVKPQKDKMSNGKEEQCLSCSFKIHQRGKIKGEKNFADPSLSSTHCWVLFLQTSALTKTHSHLGFRQQTWHAPSSFFFVCMCESVQAEHAAWTGNSCFHAELREELSWIEATYVYELTISVQVDGSNRWGQASAPRGVDVRGHDREVCGLPLQEECCYDGIRPSYLQPLHAQQLKKKWQQITWTGR